MKITADIESVDGLVRASLQAVLRSLRADLKNRKAGSGYAIFHTNPEADIAELKKHAEAFKLVLQYYEPAEKEQ